VPVILRMVHTSIDPARDAEFNEWYNTEHVHDVLRAPGAVSARRYRKLTGDSPHDYLAMYEFDSQASLDAFQVSAYRQQVWARHLDLFAPFPEPARADYELIYPR
jgi:antibiotic biosynthesis monooxygenase (ABM) superfamily enzyme